MGRKISDFSCFKLGTHWFNIIEDFRKHFSGRLTAIFVIQLKSQNFNVDLGKWRSIKNCQGSAGSKGWTWFLQNNFRGFIEQIWNVVGRKQQDKRIIARKDGRRRKGKEFGRKNWDIGIWKWETVCNCSRKRKTYGNILG